MRPRVMTFRILVGALLAGIMLPALAQSDEPARPSYSRLLNIEALIDNHVRFLARRYNLSEEQETYTQAFLRQKTDGFLQRHREELYDLVDRLVEVRAGGEMDLQELVKWGRQALPLYEEAKSLIVQGNEEWRGILSDDQRKTHDEDLRQMYESFVTTEEQLQRIVNGQMTPDEFRKGPARQAPRVAPTPAPAPPPTVTPNPPVTPPSPPAQDPPAGAQNPAPTSPAPKANAPPSRAPRSAAAPAGQQPVTPPVRPGDRGFAAPQADPRGRSRLTPRGQASPVPASADFESQWEAYVREFIQKYQLDEAQSQRAQSILKDCQDAARRQMQKRKPEIERLDKKLLTLPESKDKLKEMSEINQQRNKLLEPINEIFEKQLKPRLERLPTRTQRQVAEGAGKGTPGQPRKPGRVPQPQPQPQPQPPSEPQPPPPSPQPQPQPQPPPPPPPPPQPQPEPPENPPE